MRAFGSMTAIVLGAAVTLLTLSPTTAVAGDKPLHPKPEHEQPRPGSVGRYMETTPKVFSRLEAVDLEARTVRFVPDGESEGRTLLLAEDAQIHSRGYFGTLEDLQPGQRVWVWLDFDQDRNWTGVRVLTDELSAHMFHGSGGTVTDVDPSGDRIEVRPPRGNAQVLTLDADTRFEPGVIAEGAEVFYQQIWRDNGYVATLIVDQEGAELVRDESRRRAVERWLEHGFQGAVTWTHRSKGEARILLDAPATTWARALWRGDTVEVAVPGDDSVNATIVSVEPLHEKTELHLIIEGVDQEGLRLGEPVRLVMERPTLPADGSPPDPGRFAGREARLNWLMSSIYCTCGNSGDVCAGHFYTLAACNTKTCGSPTHTRSEVGKMIDEGLSDSEILARLEKQRTSQIYRQHIRP